MKRATAPAVLAAPPTIDAIARALTPQILIPVSEVAAELVRFRDEADKAKQVADRAVLATTQDAGNAADVLRAITSALTKLEKARKAKTEPLDKAKTQLMDLYRAAEKVYTEAKTTLQGKANVWRRAEEARLTELAEERRKKRQEEAQQLAAAQAAMNDPTGAQQIIEEAAAVVEEVPRAGATGIYGSVLGGVSRSVGEVTDRLAFLRAVANAYAMGDLGEPNLRAIGAAIEFPKSLLNALARAVNAGEVISPPGFEAGKTDNSVAR
jgi:hypothetical protein